VVKRTVVFYSQRPGHSCGPYYRAPSVVKCKDLTPVILRNVVASLDLPSNG
jgi:hypothetical protein